MAVFNPLPGGGTSAAIDFPVSVPVPVVSAISPKSSPADGPAFQLRVIGTSFVTGSIVNFNGVPLPIDL